MKNKKIIKVMGAIGVVFIGCMFFVFTRNTSSDRIENRYEKDCPTYESSKDIDEDGIDDQTDILKGALKYISKEPKYKSKYYKDIGYPNDGYGVCTDVVAFALLDAGYDLKILLYNDIILHKEEYDIIEQDINIDFRRTKNLKVYFEHTAISLTTDINDIEQWQGGDIVIFEKHIGIISDRRNKKGIPYVIHHNSSMQRKYEEDILEKREDIVGHFRIS